MKLAAVMEPFDSFWEAPEDIEKGYGKFAKFYRRNYLRYIPQGRDTRILVVSCGPGYFVKLLSEEGYRHVLGIDSDPEKTRYCLMKGMQCEAKRAFQFLEDHNETFDLIIAEQEINHLTLEEVFRFLDLCTRRLRRGGRLILHSINGANPIVASESLAQNIDHFNSYTEYSLKQVLKYSKFTDIRVFPLRLYIFYENPLNWVGLIMELALEVIFRFAFMFYGKSNRIFTKKIGAVCSVPE